MLSESCPAAGGDSGDERARLVLLAVREVSDLLGVSERHVWRLADTNEMPRPVRLGRAVRWRRRDIEAWVAAGCPSRDGEGVRR